MDDQKLSQIVKQVQANWADDPDAETFDSLSKINILIEVEKQMGVRFTQEEIPAIMDEKTLRDAMHRKSGLVKKVLVLDCDGVLWRGIIGEGTAAMTVKTSAIQVVARQLESKGILLAVCSKNNRQDVVDAFASLPDMVLKPEHIVADEISWDSKVDGLIRLAKRIGVGLDSFVFVDDSPAERAEVQEQLPQVTVIEPTIDLLPLFPNLAGKSLTEQYRNRATAVEAMTAAHDRTEFLNSLNMKAVIRVNDKSTAARCAELSNKTNQFNMTLARMNEFSILLAMENGYVFAGEMQDRFGDHGLTAMAVIANDAGEWNLIDFCVSCRVIGRGFEQAFIDACFMRIKVVYGLNVEVKTRYVPGPKNEALCKDFFQRDEPRVPITISLIAP